MQRLLIVAFGLSMGLVALVGAVPVQAQGPVVYDDASGTDGTCTSSRSTRDEMVVCTDLRPGRGVTLTEPGVAPAPAPEPAPDSTDAAPAETTETAAAPETSERAVATATDQDADNAPDELEPGLGLDPTTPDTDGDGVADGDEPNLYGTDPLVADTDGDGASDGEELFGIFTDPLVADGAGSPTEGP
jgi:hypothetical protein